MSMGRSVGALARMLLVSLALFTGASAEAGSRVHGDHGGRGFQPVTAVMTA